MVVSCFAAVWGFDLTPTSVVNCPEIYQVQRVPPTPPTPPTCPNPSPNGNYRVLVVTRVTLTVTGGGAFVFRTPPLAVSGIPCIHTAPSSAAFAVPFDPLTLNRARASTNSRMCAWCVLHRSDVLIMAQRCVMAVGRGRDTVSRRICFVVSVVQPM